MSKLMMILGVVLAAIGVALGLMVFFSPGSMQVYGLTAEVATIFLVGGILAFGQGGIISDRATGPAADQPRAATSKDAVAPAASAAATATTATGSENLSPEVSETIKALEKAKTDLQQAFGNETEKPTPAQPAEEEVSADAEEETAADDGDGQLFVIEEQTIRGHSARILSDGTVEAETSEGWMRFENLDHLNEYLDAMEPSA